MHNGGTGRGDSSELRASLEAYLNNKKRLQPIIGLCSIIECVRVSEPADALYLCEVCACRLGKVDMRNHIMGSLHRYNYMRAKHPELVPDCKEDDDLSLLAWPLMEAAKSLEAREGPGEFGIFEVKDAMFQEVKGSRVSDALTLIKSLQHEQGPGEAEWQRVVLPRHDEQASADEKAPETPQSEGGFPGNDPVIGLLRIVECRSEDGRTCCFLCHCCRTRIGRGAIADHVAGSSHMVNYLVETRPQQMEPTMARYDGSDDDARRALHAMAREVEQEEGRGELRVVNAPGFLCRLLTAKSYHWCVKMLCHAWTQSNIQLMKTAGRGPRAAEEGPPRKRAPSPPKRAKRRKAKRKPHEGWNPVFKVSLPLTKGSILLQRTSFDVDELPASPRNSSPESNPDPDPDWALATTPESECEWAPRQQEPGDEGRRQYEEPEGNEYEDTGVEVDDNLYEPTETQNQNAFGRQNTYSDWQSTGQPSHEYTSQWDYPYLHDNAGPQNPNPSQVYYHQPAYTQGHHHAMGYDSSTHPQAEYSQARMQYLEIQQRQMQTYMEPGGGHFQAAPHWTQAAALPAREGPGPYYSGGPSAAHPGFLDSACVAPGLTVSYGWAGLMLPAHTAVAPNPHTPAYPNPAYGLAPY